MEQATRRTRELAALRAAASKVVTPAARERWTRAERAPRKGKVRT